MGLIRQYKNGAGVNYRLLLSIPREARLPELAKNDYPGTLKAITMAVLLFMDGEQTTDNMIISISDAIISASEEDYLSIQDIILFLQRMQQGGYGKFYGNITLIQFMEKLELYRQERHETLTSIRDEQHAQNKSQYAYVQEANKTVGESLRRQEIDEMINQINKMYGKD